MPVSRLQHITGEDRTLVTRSALLFLQKLGVLKEMIGKVSTQRDLTKIRSYFIRLSSDLVLFEKEPLIHQLSTFLDVPQDQDDHPVSAEKKKAACIEIEACMAEVTDMLQAK